MAADSRSTQYAETKQGHKGIKQFKSTYKLFLAPRRIGIATFGGADVKRILIAHYIESFIGHHLARGQYAVDQVPDETLKHFRKLCAPPNTGFLIAGYKTTNGTSGPHIWKVSLKHGKERLNSDDRPYGYAAEGERDIFARLVEDVGIRNEETGKFEAVHNYGIDWAKFTLRDAIDYATYAVKVTIDTMRFQSRPKTVAGPIDVLVIKPDEAYWHQRKELEGE